VENTEKINIMEPTSKLDALTVSVGEIEALLKANPVRDSIREDLKRIGKILQGERFRLIELEASGVSRQVEIFYAKNRSDAFLQILFNNLPKKTCRIEVKGNYGEPKLLRNDILVSEGLLRRKLNTLEKFLEANGFPTRMMGRDLLTVEIQGVVAKNKVSGNLIVYTFDDLKTTEIDRGGGLIKWSTGMTYDMESFIPIGGSFPYVSSRKLELKEKIEKEHVPLLKYHSHPSEDSDQLSDGDVKNMVSSNEIYPQIVFVPSLKAKLYIPKRDADWKQVSRELSELALFPYDSYVARRQELLKRFFIIENIQDFH